MSEKSGKGRGNPVVALIVLTAVATLLTIGLALYGHETAAAIIGTATFFLWLSLIVVTTAVVVSWWSATLMGRGAEIALRSQESDDRRGTAMIHGLTALTQTVMRQSQPDRMALPLPSQESGSWLPEVTNFNLDDVVDGELDDGDDFS